MLDLLWLIPALPLAGFLVLAVFGRRLGPRAASVIGPGVILATAVVSLLVAGRFLASPPPGDAYTQTLWSWIDIGGFRPRIALYLDPLSLVMTVVVACVGFLIHWYSVEFMAGDEGFSRFFAYMNLFVASMVVLLLADNLLLLYLGWEGVGLCSYLLIGFWYRDPVNGRAARKAFYVTRVGDAALSLGLFLLFAQLGTLQIQDLLNQAQAEWITGGALATAAALLLLGGAVGKSAQLPLQVWLPDAMAGPTPTSALIHAATMVTAGVYLIARMNVLYVLSPTAQLAVAVVGIVTLLMAGLSALTQHDIKRVLAYSTISQIGYMFLALGVGAWAAAMFHFMTHAFFKALLFLAAGMIIEALDGEHDIFEMGGLRRTLPVAFWTFLIGGVSLAGLPLVTAGFYSKGLIIWGARITEQGSTALWVLAVIGALITSIYTFRMIFLVFYGGEKTPVARRPGWTMKAPCIILAALSIVGGFVDTPEGLGHVRLFSGLLERALPAIEEAQAAVMSELASEAIVTLAFALGVIASYYLFLARRQWLQALARPGIAKSLSRFWHSDWGMDWLYDRLFVQPILWFARINKRDVIDAFYRGIAYVTQLFWSALRATETGQVRWYAAGLVLGTVVILAIALFL